MTSASGISRATLPCLKNDKMCSIRAARSTAACRLARCEAVRWRAEFTSRWAASDSEENRNEARSINVNQRVQESVEVTQE
jgi:hypothetical protein